MNEFETSAGLGAYGLKKETESEVDRLMGLTPEEIRRLNALECAEAAFVLEQFAFHLQRGINRQQSQANWAETRVSFLIAKTIGQMSAYTPKERRAQAIADNDAASQTEKLGSTARLKVDRLSFLAQRAAAMSARMSELSSIKRVRS